MRFYKKYPRIVLLLAFSICLFLFGIGLFYSNSKVVDVTYDPLPADEPPPPMATPQTKESETSVKEIGLAKSTYYPHTKDTISTTNFSFVYSDNIYRINVQAFFETSGRKVYTPENIKLRFLYNSKDARFMDERTFLIIINGGIVFSGNLVSESKTDDTQTSSSYLIQDVPYKVFVRMANEKSVKMRVGHVTFELKDYTLQTFRDLLKTIEA